MTNHGFGAYYEHPWAGCISRDQMTGIMAALIATHDFKGMCRLILHHATRGFLFAYNTIHNGRPKDLWGWKIPDLTLLDIWATEIRGLKPLAYLLWPLLCILDVHIFIATLVNLKRKQDDPINFAIKLIIANEHLPTPLSWLAWKACDKVKLHEEIHDYWAGWRDTPEIVPYYKGKLLL
jgi:hypothetical protein